MKHTIEKINRGLYNVLDENGVKVNSQPVKLFEAERTIQEYKLQDRALNNPKVLKVAQSITGKSGERLTSWLYETLIRLHLWDLKAILKKPSYLAELWDKVIKQASKSDTLDLADRDQTLDALLKIVYDKRGKQYIIDYLNER
jgi:hypothetical protein